jgi:hypothetical protein
MEKLKRFWDSAWGPLVTGFILVFSGWMLAVLQVIPRMIQATLFLQFLTYGMSTIGLVLGVIGAARIVVSNRNAEQNEAKRKSYPWEKQQGK